MGCTWMSLRSVEPAAVKRRPTWLRGASGGRWFSGCERYTMDTDGWFFMLRPTPGRSWTGSTPDVAQVVGGADAGEHEQLRGCDGAGGQDDLVAVDDEGLAVALDLDAGLVARGSTSSP